ncbi:MAG: 50S ribosomal protein L32e [Euryarchaeota archaeon]|nr:50S ribosomal protein L32e [Euryarchaeota archaeon]
MAAAGEPRPGKEKAKEPKPAKREEAPEIVEEEEEAAKFVPKAKPDLPADLRKSLRLRQSMSRHRPAFHRQEWFRHQRLGDKWRRPKGIHSKMRRHLGYRPPVVSIGYRGPALSRGLHPSGFAEVLVHNMAELEKIDPKKQAARIAHGVGTFKAIHMVMRADELGVRLLNVGRERHEELLRMAKDKNIKLAKKEGAE